MAKVDWVPCVNYGVAVTAGPDTLSAFPLYGLPDSTVDDYNKVEDKDDWCVCLRIVGDVWLNRLELGQGSTSGLICHWRIMPLQVDIDGAVPQLPIDPNTNAIIDQGYANCRWWDERVRQVQPWDSAAAEPTQELDNYSHPWWTHVDCSPKQAFGRNLNLWPCIVFYNLDPDLVTMTWRVRLRLLVKYR